MTTKLFGSDHVNILPSSPLLAPFPPPPPQPIQGKGSLGAHVGGHLTPPDSWGATARDFHHPPGESGAAHHTQTNH